MHGATPTVFSVLRSRHTNFFLHLQVIFECAFFDKRPIKEVPVVSHPDIWSQLLAVFKETNQQVFFICFVEHDEWSWIRWFRSVLEIVNIFRNHLAVNDQVSLTIEHVRNHKDLVVICIRKFQRCFGALDIKRQYARFSFHQLLGRWLLFHGDCITDSRALDRIPRPGAQI